MATNAGWACPRGCGPMQREEFHDHEPGCRWHCGFVEYCRTCHFQESDEIVSCRAQEDRDAEAAAGALEQIRARLAAASLGPWSSYDSGDSWSLHAGLKQILKAPKHGTPYAEYWPEAADAELIEYAPTDIATLLAAIDTAVKRLGVLDAMATTLGSSGHPVLAGTFTRAVAHVRDALADGSGQRPDAASPGECA